MNPLNYSDNKISSREFMFSLPSIVIGVSVLSLPRDIANVTMYSDGWVSILIAGIFFTIMALLAIRVSLHFPDKSFIEYASILVTKPVAITICLLYALSGIFLSSFITRTVAYISQQYLFERTPLQVLGLAFLLVVIYGVAGSRAGIFRLGTLFLPIILIIFFVVTLFNIKWIDTQNYLPLFKTDLKGYKDGILQTFGAYIGFGIGLFYISQVKDKTKLNRKVIIGMSIPTIFYLIVFLCSIGVFSNKVTGNLMLPALELALKVDIPGAIFERVDAFVYTIWIMAIFNTVTIFLDASILLIRSVFKKVSKQAVIFTLAPTIYFFSMLPKQMGSINNSIQVVSKINIIFSCTVIIALTLVIKLKGIKRHESS